MIVAITNTQGQSLKRLLAANLAVLRTRSGHKICMLDADPQHSAYRWSCARQEGEQGPLVPTCALPAQPLTQAIDDLHAAYSDLLIHTGEGDSDEARSALKIAGVALVPLQVSQASITSQYALIARLNSARILNPSLKVLFVLVSEGHSPSAEEVAAVRHYVAHVMAAKLASTILHAPNTDACEAGACICDADTCDSNAAAELNALYREVFMH